MMTRSMRKGLALVFVLCMMAGLFRVPAEVTAATSAKDRVTVLADAVYDEAVTFSDSVAFLENGNWSDGRSWNEGEELTSEGSGNVTKDTKIVFVDKNGEKIVVKNQNSKGQTIFDAIYPSISGDVFNIDALKLIKNGKIAYIMSDGTYFGGSLKYYYYANLLNNNLMMVSDDAKTYKVINSDNKVVLNNITNLNPYYPVSYVDGRIAIRCTDKWYLLEEDGTLIDTYKGNNLYARACGNGYLYVKGDESNKIYLLNPENEIYKTYSSNVTSIDTTYIDKGYIKVAELGTSGTVYKYINAKTDKVLVTTQGWASFDGQVIVGQRQSGITSVSSINGKVYINDLYKYIEQIGEERGYKEITSYSYYEQGTLLLSLMDLQDSTKNETAVLTLADEFAKPTYVDGKFDRMKEGYFTTCNENWYLTNLCKMDGTIVKSYSSAQKYRTSGWLGTITNNHGATKLDLLWTVLVMDDVTYDTTYYYMTSDGKIHGEYSYLYATENFLVLDATSWSGSADKPIKVKNAANETVYTGGDGNERFAAYESRECFVITKDGRNYLYDSDGNLMFGDKVACTELGYILVKGSYAANKDDCASEYCYRNTLEDNGLWVYSVDNDGKTQYGAIRVYDDMSIKKAKITLSATSYTYNGKAKKPTAKVVIDGKTLVSGEDYKLSYKNNTNVGTATVTITGIGDYIGTVSKTYKINAASVAKATVTLSATSYTYSGAAKKPSVKSVVLGSTTLKAGTDYKVSYKNNTKAGTATVTITGLGNYTGTVSKTYTIKKASLAKATVKLSATSYTYDGKAKKPTVKSVVLGSKTLKAGTDYKVTYKNNTTPGTATVTITGLGNYTGTVNKSFTIKKISIANAKVTLSATTYTYDGKAKKPTVKSVVLGGKTLKAGTHYKVTYKNNTNAGSASVVITGLGNYAGTVNKVFTINVRVGTTFTYGAYKYKVTSTSAVTFTGLKSNTTTKVVIPATATYAGKKFKVTAIADEALEDKTKVTSVTIGSNVKTIGKSAFEDCKRLKTVTIGSAVTTIGDRAFRDCEAIESIIIPAKVTKIGKQAFRNCEDLKKITIKSTKITKVGDDAFKNIKSKATIKVPSSKLTGYKKLFKGKGLSSRAKIEK